MAAHSTTVTAFGTGRRHDDHRHDLFTSIQRYRPPRFRTEIHSSMRCGLAHFVLHTGQTLRSDRYMYDVADSLPDNNLRNDPFNAARHRYGNRLVAPHERTHFSRFGGDDCRYAL